MNRQGFVTKINDRYVTVSTQPLACCSGEATCSCLQAGKFVEFRALRGNFNLMPGDIVDVENPKGKSLRGLFRMLLFPGLLCAAGFAVASLAREPAGADPVPVLAGIAGLLAGGTLNFFFLRYSDRDFPVVTKKIPAATVKFHVPKIP